MDLNAGAGKSTAGRRGRGLAMKGSLCMPRLGRASHRPAASPALSMLERFREAVLRLIMLSDISKGNGGRGGGTSSLYGCSTAPFRANYSQETHYGEAMADCIDFIKKSSASSSAAEGGRDSVASDIVEVEPATVPVV